LLKSQLSDKKMILDDLDSKHSEVRATQTKLKIAEGELEY
jgi:hypothetical protein